MWCDYILGVALVLRERGYRLRAAGLLVDGEIPMGAGLSSSAAIEVASALAFLALLDSKLDPLDVAKLCHRAENTFVGARVGIMDQFVSCLGRQGHALLLDCRSLRFELVPIDQQVKLVICNTMVKHELSGGEYNRRREECDQGVRILSRFYPEIRALRDVSLAQLEAHAGSLPPVIYNRCRHVVEENGRVLETVECFRSGQLVRVGALMRASHQSLRDLYEVSCRELDLMVEAAEGLAGCYGARMTGGGFGGSTVNLVEAGQVRAFAETVADRYRRQTGTLPKIYICSPADGAGMELKLTPA
jgi:galactokinase